MSKALPLYTLRKLKRENVKNQTIKPLKYIHYISEKPNVTVCSSNIITVNEGESLSCSCSSKGGNPPANVTWRKYGKEEISKTKERNNTLFLKGVSKGDAGNYECTAESYPDYKYRDTKTINVSVNCKYQLSGACNHSNDI